MKNRLIIIDGHALIHRSFHALPTTLRTKSGQITNAVYGFSSFLIKALDELKPNQAILSLDKKGTTFRHQIFKDYKANRVKAPDELYQQIPLVKEVAQAFGLPIIELEGFEADDLIGTLVKTINTQEPKTEIIIITGDSDTLQLVNPQTKVYTMSRGLNDSILYDEAKVMERFQLKPQQLIDLKALKGDASDNIPGVPGVGEKTAQELLKNFETLENIYNNINDPRIKERTRKLLLEHRELAFLSQKLVRIDSDVPISFDFNQSQLDSVDKNTLNDVFKKLEFRSLLPRILKLKFIDKKGSDKFSRNQESFNYQLINTDTQFKSFLSELKKQSLIAFDTETNSLKALEAKLIGISFCWKADEAYFLDLRNDNLSQWLQEMKSVFENEKVEKIAHNLKYDLQVLQNYNINIKGKIFDTMIASYLLNPENRQHSLDSLSFTELNWEKISSEELLGDKNNKFEDLEAKKLALYSAEDADCTFKLQAILKKKLKQRNLLDLFEKLEIPLLKVLSDMERTGIKIDLQFLKNLGANIKKDIKIISSDIYQLSNQKFNLNSPQQLQEVLFNDLKINSVGIKKTKTGLSTASEQLDKIRDLHPIIPLIQNYRELKKLSSTYIESLPQLVNTKTNRIHSNFNQTITVTGRLSSSDPNLQNIPARTELGRQIRQAFVAGKEKYLLSLDYSQIELRVMAHLSEDESLLSAFKNKIDIHRATAAKIKNIPLEKVSNFDRQEAKAINFGIIYGQGPHGLSQSARISYQEARNFIQQYFQSYPGVKKFIDYSIATAQKKGYTNTILNRSRYIPDINSSEVLKRKAAERMAINSPIQGSAADIIKKAMIEIYQEIENQNDIKLLLQVHDELIFEVQESKLELYYPRIKKIMENVFKLKVPLVVEVQYGKNWGQLKNI